MRRQVDLLSVVTWVCYLAIIAILAFKLLW
jgi:hypothetical protein